MTAALAQPARWTPLRKAEVVEAIRRGELSRDAAIAGYDLSAEELESWITREERFGVRGLAIERIQELRI